MASGMRTGCPRLGDDARVDDVLELPDGRDLGLRRAQVADVPAIVRLIVEDQISAARESADLAPYEGAFRRIDADPAQLLLAAVVDGEVAGTLQLTVIPGLSRVGALRGQVEAVRVRADLRGRGIGEAMVRWAVEEARRRGCALVQLTTDKRRTDAHRFYARLGFTASHEGFKLQL
jgi:GNAT superfamily N-acetyltransferase